MGLQRPIFLALMRLTFKWVPGISLGRGDPLIILSPFALVAKIHIYGRFFVAKIYLPLQMTLQVLQIQIQLSESVDRLEIGLMDLKLWPPKDLAPNRPVRRKGIEVPYQQVPQRTCRVQKTPDSNSGSPDEHFGTPWSHIGPLFRSSNFSLVPSSNFGLLEEQNRRQYSSIHPECYEQEGQLGNSFACMAHTAVSPMHNTTTGGACN